MQPDQQTRHRGAAVRLLAAQLCDGGQGIHPAPARPRVVRHDRDDPGDAADAVRLRHQHHAAQSADRGAAAGGQRSRALDPQGAGEHRLFPLHPGSARRRRVRQSPAVGQGAVRRRNSARLRARGAARRPSGAAGRGRRHRSGRGGLGAVGARRHRADRAAHDLLHRRSAVAAVRDPRPCPLQPGGVVAAQHRARPGRHHPDHDHADLHRAVGDARDRARHHGKPAVDADHAGRGDVRQDRALRAGRLHPGHR